MDLNFFPMNLTSKNPQKVSHYTWGLFRNASSKLFLAKRITLSILEPHNFRPMFMLLVCEFLCKLYVMALPSSTMNIVWIIAGSLRCQEWYCDTVTSSQSWHKHMGTNGSQIVFIRYPTVGSFCLLISYNPSLWWTRSVVMQCSAVHYNAVQCSALHCSVY